MRRGPDLHAMANLFLTEKDYYLRYYCHFANEAPVRESWMAPVHFLQEMVCEMHRSDEQLLWCRDFLDLHDLHEKEGPPRPVPREGGPPRPVPRGGPPRPVPRGAPRPRPCAGFPTATIGFAIAVETFVRDRVEAAWRTINNLDLVPLCQF